MKRRMAILLAAVLLLGFAACGRNNNGLPKGVSYVEAYTLESDPGDNLSASAAAVKLFEAVTRSGYTPGDAVTITLTALVPINNVECYLYSVVTPDGETLHAVDYASGAVYSERGGNFLPIVEGLGVAMDVEAAQARLIETFGELTREGTAWVAEGEDAVNGRRAWLFAWGKNTPEKFTAEKRFAVTDLGEIFVMDILGGGEYIPYAVG